MCKTLKGSGLRRGTNSVIPGFPETSKPAVGDRKSGTGDRGFLLHKLDLRRWNLLRQLVFNGRSYSDAVVAVAINVDDGDVVFLSFGNQGHGGIENTGKPTAVPGFR